LATLCLVGDVAREPDRGAVGFLGGFLADVLAPRRERNVCARRAQSLPDAPPDPRGRAHHEHPPTYQTVLAHHRFLLGTSLVGAGLASRAALWRTTPPSTRSSTASPTSARTSRV